MQGRNGIDGPFAEERKYSVNIVLLKRINQWAKYLVITIIIIATLVLFGWQLDIEFFKHPIPGSKSMNPAAAVAFIFASASFFFLAFAGQSKWKRSTGYFLAVLVLMIGLLKFLSVISVFNFQIDSLLFSGKVKEDRIVPIAAINFILTGMALLLLDFETVRKKIPSHYIVLIVFLLGLLSLVGYLYNVKTSNGVLVYLPMAIHAAVCFLLLSLAILFINPGKGIMKEFTSPFSGSFMARFLIPAAIILPVLLGLLRLWVEWTKLLPIELGTALLILTIVIVFLSMTWFIVVSLNKRDKLRLEIENALRESERQMQTIFNAAPDAVIVIDDEGRIVKWNPRAEFLMGWQEKEMLGKLLSEAIIPERFREAHKKGLRHFLRTGEGPLLGKVVETFALTKKGTELDIALNIAATSKINNKHLFIGFLRDITEQKEAETKLRESEQLFSTLFYKSQVMKAINEISTGKFIEVNDAFANFWGYKKEEIIGKSSTEINLLINAENRQQMVKELQENGYVRNMEVQVTSRNGTNRWISSSIDKIVVSGKDCLLSDAIDITVQKKSEEKFRSLLSAAPDATIIVNDKGIIEMINHQTENLFGYHRDELIGKPVELLIPEDIRNKHIGHRSDYGKSPKVRSMGAGIELNAIKKNGTMFPVEISLSPLQTEVGLLVSASVRDISDRKKGEEKLKESEEKLRILFNSIDEGFCIIEMIFDEHKKPVDYRFLVVNPSFEKQTGLHDAAGKRMREFAPDHEDHWFEIYGRIALTGESIRFVNRAEQLHRWYDVYAFRFGEPKNLQVAILFNDITDRIQSDELIKKQKQDIQDFIDSMSTLSAKVDVDGNLLMVNKIAQEASGLSMKELMQTNFLEGKWWTFDPQVHQRVHDAFKKACSGSPVNYAEQIFVFNQVLTINFSLIPIFKPDGKVDYIVAEARDITALKITEAQLTERTNQLVALNSELEAFTYSVSHDLRTPLRGIIGFTNILEEDYASKLDDEAKRLAAVIKSNTIKMGQLIDDLLAFSRMGRQDILKTTINTATMVNEIVDELGAKEKNIKWDVHPLPKINGDINTIRQVWINLISNAIKYSGNKKKPSIEIGFSDQGRQFVFYVKDNGVGFDDKYKDKLFKVFQRLHGEEEFEGTGVGLALVEKIVSKHGGKVWAEGKTNEGACFYFSLPA